MTIGHVFRCEKDLIWYYDENGCTLPMKIATLRLMSKRWGSGLCPNDFKGMKFHCVRYRYGPETWMDVIDWANEHIGSRNYAVTAGRAWFDDPALATIFKLRWG